MSSELTHERCSELLLAYAQDELGDADTAQVTDHLASCAECRAELSGLTALLEPEAEGLTDAERERLHRGIEAALQTRGRAQAPVATLDDRRRQRWGQRAIQALGVAAALAVVAVGVSYLASGGSGVDQGALEDGGGEAATGGAAAELPGPSPRFVAERRLVPASPQAATSEDRTTDNSSREFFLAGKDASRHGYLANLGRSPLLDRFSNSYDAAEATEFGSALIDSLASDAGDASEQVSECAANVAQASPGPAVPVFGSLTRFKGDRALVIAFIYTDEKSGPLDRYTIWVWRRGSCEAPVSAASGSIR